MGFLFGCLLVFLNAAHVSFISLKPSCIGDAQIEYMCDLVELGGTSLMYSSGFYSQQVFYMI